MHYNNNNNNNKMMARYLFTTVGTLLIMFLFANCNGEKKSTKQSNSPQTDKEEFQTPPEPEPAPAPGSATVEALVQSVDSTSNAILCTIQVKEVTAYGAGTPTIGKGSTLTLEVNSAVFKNNRSELVAENELLLHIASAKNVSLDTGSNTKENRGWQLVSIKK